MTARADPASWYRALRIGAWVPIVLGLAVSLGLAGLHYYQQEQLRRATNNIRDLGRARQDLAHGFLHVTLGGGADAPWQRDRGYVLLSQALAHFERATGQTRLETARVNDFEAELERFRTLLQRLAGASVIADRDALELRLALYHLDAAASRVDRELLDDLAAMRAELRRAFGMAFVTAVLVLIAASAALHGSRRQALSAVRMLQSIASSSTDSIYAKDVQGRYLLFNKEASRITGAPVHAALGHDDRDILSPQEAERLMANDRRVMVERQTHTYDEEITTVGGPRTYLSTKGPLLDEEGQVVGVFGISRDITDRKRAERTLEESRAQLEAVIDSLNEGLVLARPEGELLRVNSAARPIYGLNGGHARRIDDLQGVLEVATLDGQKVPFANWPMNRVRRGEHLRDVELVVRRVDHGWSKIYSFGGRLVRDESGEPILALVMMNDVTPRHQAEETVRRTQRMEALGELAAGIAHDFNNILMAMAGNARLAEDELPVGHPARECLHEIVRASARAGDLVRSILLFSRAEEPQRRTVNLAPLIQEALALVRPTTPSMIRFRTQVAEHVPPVNIDPSQFHQVIVNLVTNSVYAIVHGPHRQFGNIDISVDAHEIEDATEQSALALAPGKYVRLRLTDNGGGMDQATLSKMFNPFFTTKPVGKGTGLGMSVVHGIIRNHDGAISVQSQLNEGTTVEIYLPAAREKVESAAPERTASAEGHRRRVLYLDDEEALVFLAVRFLRKRGHVVTGLTDPLEALRVFAAAPNDYDVVITDMSMPTMSGFDVAKSMLEVRRDIVILMMSGYVRVEDREAALALGVKDLLLKPSTIEELADAVDRQI